MGIIFQNGIGIGTVPNNTYTPLIGQWILATEGFGYQPAWTNGVITFPSFIINEGLYDPNQILTANAGLYINAFDAAGIPQPTLFNLLNQSGTIRLSQGSNNITFAYESGSFQDGGGMYNSVYWGGEGAPLTLVTTTNTSFNGYAYGDNAGNELTYVSSGIAPNNSQLIDITIHTDTTFTLESSMLLNLYSICGSGAGEPNGTSGFTVTTTTDALWCGVNGQTTNNSTITTAFENAGIGQYDSEGYLCSVEWGAGSSVRKGYAKVSYQSNNGNMNICPLDPTDSSFYQNNNSGTALTGTFNFPATFTILRPTDAKGGWC